MSQVAFIGIGAMGEPMAANLLKKGFAVTVVQRKRAEPAARLKALGARTESTPVAAAKDCELIILCLPTSREVEAVIEGKDGLAAHVAKGTVIVDCSTSNPPSTRRISALLRERGIGLVAAGMTRGIAGAKQGTLAFFIGGEQADIDKAMPALKAMGDTFVQFRSAAEAHAAKVISNVLSYGTVALVNEAIMLGAKSGVDPKTLHEALMQGAPSKALEAFGPRLVSGEYDPPRVTVEHVCDDMVLAQEMAAAGASPIFMLGAAQQLYRMTESQGHGARDMSIIAELWRAAAKA